MAVAQSGDVARLITERTGRRWKSSGVTTLGDVSRAALTQIGGTGVFVSALRESLLRGEVDFAVHSLKDLPTGAAPGITLAAVPGPRRPARRAGRPGRGEARRTCRPGRGSAPGRRAGPPSSRCCAPTSAACRSGEREYQAGQGPRRGTRRGGARLRGAGQDRAHRPGQRDLRARRHGPGARPGRARRGVPRRGHRARRAARDHRPPGDPRGGDGGAQPAGRARSRVQRPGGRLRGAGRARHRLLACEGVVLVLPGEFPAGALDASRWQAEWWCGNAARQMRRTRRASGVSWRRGCWRLARPDLIARERPTGNDAHD